MTGDWVSTGAANMYVAGTDGVLEQRYLGDGIAFTIGDEVIFDGTYNWSSTFISQGIEMEVPAGELIPTVTLIVEGSTCEEAWGQVAIPMINEIRNLGECAERFFGAEQLEFWKSVLSSVVSNSIIGIALYQQPPINGYELLALVDAGLAAGAFGPHQFASENGQLADSLLQARAQEIFDDALVPVGGPVEDGNTCQAARGCIYPDMDEAATILAGRLMGWDFTLADGSTMSAAQMGQYWTDEGYDFEGTIRGTQED